MNQPKILVVDDDKEIVGAIKKVIKSIIHRQIMYQKVY